MGKLETIFRKVVDAKTAAEVEAILTELGASNTSELDTPFNEYDMVWHALGDNESNLSAVNLATDPSRSIVERITNAMDAVLELKCVEGKGADASSPTEFVHEVFGREPSADEAGLFKLPLKIQTGISEQVNVVLLESGVDDAPTLDVVDNGIGIRPKDFGATILSIQQGNKIDKPYLIGSHGQGGSSAIKFAKYTAIVSRYFSEPNTFGFTIIKKLDPPPNYSQSYYGYLAIKSSDGAVCVPSVEDSSEFPVYENEEVPEKVLPIRSRINTLARHVEFQIPKFSGPVTPANNSLYHALNQRLFDPHIPFRIRDFRRPDSKGKFKNEFIGGNRNRLHKQAVMPLDHTPNNGVVVLHKSPRHMLVPFGEKTPSVQVEYWVMLHYKNGKQKSKGNESYVIGDHPFIYTLNGQNQGEKTATLLKNIGLGRLSKHFVCNIDLSLVTQPTREELLATNRESLVDSRVLTKLEESLSEILQEDSVLAELEQGLANRALADLADKTDEEVVNRVSKLLRRAGLRNVRIGPAVGRDPGGKRVSDVNESPAKPAAAIVAKTFPLMSQFEIETPKDKVLKVRKGEGISTVVIITDAGREFEERNLFNSPLVSTNAIELDGVDPLKAGRKKYRFRATDDAKVGDVGQVTFSVKKPMSIESIDEYVEFHETIEFEIVPPRNNASGSNSANVPEIKIFEISRGDPAWHQECSWPSDALEAVKVSYKTTKSGDMVHVFISTEFTPFLTAAGRCKTKKEEELFKAQYKAWIVMHAVLQETEIMENQKKGISYNHTSKPDTTELEIGDFDRSNTARMTIEAATDYVQVELAREKAING